MPHAHIAHRAVSQVLTTMATAFRVHFEERDFQRMLDLWSRRVVIWEHPKPLSDYPEVLESALEPMTLALANLVRIALTLRLRQHAAAGTGTAARLARPTRSGQRPTTRANLRQSPQRCGTMRVGSVSRVGRPATLITSPPLAALKRRQARWPTAST